MKKTSSFFIAAMFTLLSPLALATQADDTTITIDAQAPGATPFIDQLTLTASDTSVIKSVRFLITPKPGSDTRPLSGTYSNGDLTAKGYLLPDTGQIFLPVYGLYSDFTNTVTLTYLFNDGSSKQDSTTITTAAFDDPCGYENPTVLQAKIQDAGLSFDYVLIKGGCSSFSPAIIDTDSALRWVGTAGAMSSASTFFDNAVYQTSGTILYRIDLDGTVTLLHDYTDTDFGTGPVTLLHHNIELGKTGLVLEADTAGQVESTLFEIDVAGNVLKNWNMADIISAAMTAGGDDPSQFVSSSPFDWFHNNASTYNRADDSLLVSSRENFVIALDYETSTIKWILGDPTKAWHQFPSLQQFELVVASGSLPPIGQHALSIAYDQHLLLFDNGFQSTVQMPPGASRDYASPRKYKLDLEGKTATEVWNYEMDQSVNSPICSSIYEDAPLNYLVDYADVNGPLALDQFSQLLALNAAGEKIFYYQYPTFHCDTIYNSIPLHLENTKFPTVGPRPLNISTRGLVGTDEESLIGGFIVSGTDSETVVLRALGPSLTASGLSQTVADPTFTLYDSSGAVVATNDNWQSDPGASQIAAGGLAPTEPAEAATIQTLTPGAYTFVVTGKDLTPGIGLVEAYDLSPLADSELANLSTRGSVGTGDDVLISGFIIGDVESNTIVIRALGPSVASSGVNDPLSDPMLTVVDSNGATIATNDNWNDDLSAADLTQRGLAPADDAEAATILHLPAGAYTTIVSGSDGATGIGLVEFYDL
jgi:arylsulfate sulfotransferase